MPGVVGRDAIRLPYGREVLRLKNAESRFGAARNNHVDSANDLVVAALPALLTFDEAPDDGWARKTWLGRSADRLFEMIDRPLSGEASGGLDIRMQSRVHDNAALPADTGLEHETALVCIVDEQLDEPDCQALSRIAADIMLMFSDSFLPPPSRGLAQNT